MYKRQDHTLEQDVRVGQIVYRTDCSGIYEYYKKLTKAQSAPYSGCLLYTSELINRIQNLRKESDFNVTDKIDLHIGKHKEINEAVENFKTYIASQVLAENVTLIDKAEDGAQPIEIDDIQTFIKIQKM